MNDERDLHGMFDLARASGPAPSAGLMARVLADAYDAQPQMVPAPIPVVLPTRPVWQQTLASLAAALGGGGGLAGLGTAAIAGLFIGYASPDLSDWMNGAIFSGSAESYDLLTAADLFLTEG